MTTPEERADKWANGLPLTEVRKAIAIEGYLAGFAECERLKLSGDLARVRFVGEIPPLPYEERDT